MSRKQEYREKNENFLKEIQQRPDVNQLPGGVFYRVLQKGESERKPTPRSIVTVHYKGSLVGGRVFDDSHSRPCPEAFRLNELIAGWQIALLNMCVGDRWEIFIPAHLGYGTRTSGPIPGNSTLIFDIELLGIA